MYNTRKSLCKIFIIFAFLFGLSACGPIYNTHSDYTSPKSWRGKQCVNQCLQNRSDCQIRCGSNYQSCRNNARLVATPSYLVYVDERTKNGKKLRKTIDDFADYSSCQESCGCDESYNQCFTNCGGKITTTQVCVAFCKPTTPPR